MQPPRGVLITRPAHQATGLIAAVTAAGWEAIPFPVLAIAPVPDRSAALAALAAAAAAQLLIFISPNAVAQAVSLLPDGLPTAPRLAAVGDATAAALQYHFGRAPDLLPASGRYDSEGLLALPALQQLQQQRVVIVRGVGGRELLASVLRQRGAEVVYAELYQRQLPASDAAALLQQRDRVAMVTITSGEALRNLCTLIDRAGGGEWLRQLPLLLVGERNIALAATLGFKQPPRLAAGAGDAALLAALEAWQAQR